MEPRNPFAVDPGTGVYLDMSPHRPVVWTPGSNIAIPCRSRFPAGSDALYSYFSVSTGSRRAAPFAGTVPKITPTMTEVASAMTADRQSVGIL
jgi:hypothetical protein